MSNDLSQQKKILLGHLNSNGDCLYATAVARQIKHDYPGCHLTWAIGSACRPSLDGNPHVDEVWEVPLGRISEETVVAAWQQFEHEAGERRKKGDFDEVFLTQYSYGRLQNYAGTTRSSVFRGYPGPITVPIAPIVRLSLKEIENVRHFAMVHRLVDRSEVILFECSPKSNQSFVTPDFALAVTQQLIAAFPAVSVILSSNVSFQSADERIIDGSVLSFRENVELTKHCSLLIGCSSGISWLSTAESAKLLPMIQLIKDDFWTSMVNDHRHWGLATNKIIEMTTCPVDTVYRCVEAIFKRGFDTARLLFHEQIPLPATAYEVLFRDLLRQNQYRRGFIFGFNSRLRLKFAFQWIKSAIRNSVAKAVANARY